METSSTLAMEDDGSLLIISRISTGSDESLEDETITAIKVNSLKDSDEDSGNGTDQDGKDEAQHFTEVMSQSQPEAQAQKDSDNDGDLREEETEDVTDHFDLEALDNLLEMELQNLESMKKANEGLKRMVSLSGTATPPPKPEENLQDKKDEGAAEDNNSANGSTSKTGQNPFRKLPNFRRRRNQQPRQNQPIDFKHFVQDYYRSLDSVSQYMIAATAIGFCLAFLLLTFQGSLIHKQNMEELQSKEKQFLAQQALYEKSQIRHESFRESLLHQRYEEARQCHSTLNTYLIGRDDLLGKISKLEKEKYITTSQLEATIKAQRKEIEELKLKIKEFEQGQAKKNEKAQSGSFFSRFFSWVWKMLSAGGNTDPASVVIAGSAPFVK